MKTLLVPVDFSPASADALRYAAKLAGPLGAGLICLHAIEDFGMRKEFIDKIQQFISDEEPSLNDGIKAQPVIMAGTLDKVLRELSGIQPIDLIVMGTKGAKGFQKVMGGSNTTDVLSTTNIPVLIVPQGYVFHPIRYILWANDYRNVQSEEGIKPLIEIATAFDSEIRVAHVKTTDRHGPPEKHRVIGSNRHFLEEMGIRHSFRKIRWTDITGGISYYLELKGDNDLLTLVQRRHGFLSRMFRLDHTYEFACNPILPLLVIQE